MDCQSNLPTPSKTPNEIYHKRQPTCESFNINVLSTNDSFFYCYDETIDKGVDELTSVSYKFCTNRLFPDVTSLDGFYHVRAGQNKKFTVFRFMYWIVHTVRRFDSIKMVFQPVDTVT